MSPKRAVWEDWKRSSREPKKMAYLFRIVRKKDRMYLEENI